MIEVILGFIICWILLGLFEITAEQYDWRHTQWYYWIMAFPILIVIVPLGVLCMIIYKPWQNVIIPVEKDKWDEIMNTYKNKYKYIHIGRFYICFEPKAKLINKLFFIRVKK